MLESPFKSQTSYELSEIRSMRTKCILLLTNGLRDIYKVIDIDSARYKEDKDQQ